MTGFTEGRDALRAGEKINYEGASGPLDFDEKGDVKALFKLSVMKNGKIEFIRMLDL
jgi:branched-chain amino acid transport system substrate-binding protein